MNKIELNAEQILGQLRFKKYDGLVPKYVNGTRTEEYIGFFIIVESLDTLLSYRIKVLNISKDIKLLENEPKKYFDKLIVLKNLKIKPYVSGKYVNWSITATSLVFKNE